MKGGILSLSDIRTIIPSYAVGIHQINIHTFYAYNNTNWIDYDWIVNQITYIEGLSDRKKHIIREYTKDAYIACNAYLRGSLSNDLLTSLVHTMTRDTSSNPYIYQHMDATGIWNSIDKIYVQNMRHYIGQFIQEFEEIIHNAPKLTKEVKVFRGIHPSAHLTEINISNANGFISTSLDICAASRFTGSSCCLLEIIIQPNTECLFTGYISRRRNEYEITISHRRNMNITAVNTKYILDDIDHYNNTDVFLNTRNYDDIVSKTVYDCVV